MTIELVTPYVHFFNRGVNKEAIFYPNGGYDYLLQLIYRFLPDYPIELEAYCLMPNHYHLLLRVETLIAGSRYIQRVFNAYTQGVNKQVGRVGNLFQGNVKKRFVENETYLRETIKYIHLNPVKAGLVREPEAWKYSDYTEWIGLKKILKININLKYYVNTSIRVSIKVRRVGNWLNFNEGKISVGGLESHYQRWIMVDEFYITFLFLPKFMTEINI